MLERTEDGVCLSCDYCSEEQIVKGSDIQAIHVAAGKHGWQVVEKCKGKYEYMCPSCVEDRAPVQHV